MLVTPVLSYDERAAYPTVEAPCPYFGTCGGCTLQDLAYADQLSLKRARIQRAFASLGAERPIELVPLDDPWRYRNKAEFTFGESDGQLVLGYHAARSFWRVVDLEDCLLLPEPAMRVVREVRVLAADSGLPAYQPRRHEGFFRYLVVRSSRATGRVLLMLVTAPGAREAVDAMTGALVARHPAVASVYWGTTSKLADVAVPEELLHLAGAAFLEDRLGPFRLQLHPLSFLQPSSLQAERIYERLCEGLCGSSPAVAWDLYCGVGVIALYLSRRAGKVYGIDCEGHHLEVAARNVSLNGVRNVEFRAGRVETLLMDRRVWLQEARPDVIAVDPPRAGLHPQALSSLLAGRPARIAYLSCNVQSLIRDLRVLLAGFPRYRLSAVTAFDMFPQTQHVETLALLVRA